MPEVLFLGKDNENEDPEINSTLCWKKGDIIQVFKDGWTYGRLEKPPIFFKIIVPDSTIEELTTDLIGPILGNPIRISTGIGIEEHPPEIIKKSRRKLDFDSLPNNIKGRLLKQGEIVLKYQTLKKYIYDKQKNRMMNEED